MIFPPEPTSYTPLWWPRKGKKVKKSERTPNNGANVPLRLPGGGTPRIKKAPGFFANRLGSTFRVQKKKEKKQGARTNFDRSPKCSVPFRGWDGGARGGREEFTNTKNQVPPFWGFLEGGNTQRKVPKKPAKVGVRALTTKVLNSEGRETPQKPDPRKPIQLKKKGILGVDGGWGGGDPPEDGLVLFSRRGPPKLKVPYSPPPLGEEPRGNLWSSPRRP